MSTISIAGISIAALILLLAGTLLISIIGKKRHTFQKSVRRILLMVRLPKELPGQEKEVWNNEKIREAISHMESFLATLAGLKAERGGMLLSRSRQDTVSFEIAAYNKEIFFYINIPPHLAEHVKHNALAAFPMAQIERVSGYNIFPKNSHSAASIVRMTRSFALPLKTYKTLEGDPLNHITNAFSKLENDEGAAIQYIVRSAPKKWHRLGTAIAHEMQKGKHYKEAIKIAERGIIAKSASAVTETVTTTTQKENDQQKENKLPHGLSPQEQEMLKGIEEKTSKAGFEMNIRIVVSTQSSVRTDSLLSTITNTFNQFNLYEYGNKLEAVQQKKPETVIKQFIFRQLSSKNSLTVNSEELASLFHFPLPSTETPNIHWLKAKTAPVPLNLPLEGVVIGKNIYREKETAVTMGIDDRRRHVYIIGMTGTGKSALIQNMAEQDIKKGHGVAVIDPHGDLAENLLSVVPPSRMQDVIYFNPADTERPIGLNMLEADDIHEQDFAIQEMIMIFYKLVTDPAMIGPIFEHNMRNAMLTLMADRNDPGTITEIPRMFTDPAFQKYKLKSVTDPMVRAFWEKEMAKTSDFHKSETLGYLISKVGRFVENSMMRNIIGQPHSGFNFKKVMNEGKILLVNLSKGQVGEVNSNLLGLILVSKLQMAALARATLPEKQRKDFFLYIDEFQNYTTDSIATILSEARKYHLNLTMAHQYIGQLVAGQDTKVRDAVLGNVGTMISFRIGVEDTDIMEKQFEPVFNAYDLVNVDKYNAFVKTIINNAATRPFSIETLPPSEGDLRIAEELKEQSRTTYGRARGEVEQEIIERSNLGADSVSMADAIHTDSH